MRSKVNTTLGFYRPSFFKMQVNDNANLEDLSKLTDWTSAIYLHEYIHFIQDITTTYGFSNISNVVDFVKYANQHIINGKLSTFNVPITPKPAAANQTSFIKKVKKEYLGDSNDVTTAVVTDVVINTKTITLKTGNASLDTIIIDYHDGNGNASHHQFGSHCILESMAYIIENTVYPNILPAPPDFPYKSAQKVIEHEYKAFLSDPLNALALCDASLGKFNPGEFFFDILSKMKAANYLPSKPEDVYAYCSANAKRFNFHGSTTLTNLLSSTSATANREIQDYFTTKIFSDTKQWINLTIKNAVSIRLSNPYFVLEIARGGNIQQNKAFIDFYNKVGSPMVSNSNHEGTFYSPLSATLTINPEYLWATSQIYGIYIKSLANNPQKCELKPWCRNSCLAQQRADFTDNNCYNSPWLRANYTQLCPFAVMWKTWELQNKTPV